jgi:hypothetical protein
VRLGFKGFKRRVRVRCVLSGGDEMGEGMRSPWPVVVANLSARVSSVGDNRLGGWHSYRASKCALNQRAVPSCAAAHLHCGVHVRKVASAAHTAHSGQCAEGLSGLRAQ